MICTWLPKVSLEAGRLLKCLERQNPTVPMNEWSVLKKEESQKNSQSYRRQCKKSLSRPDLSADLVSVKRRSIFSSRETNGMTNLMSTKRVTYWILYVPGRDYGHLKTAI